MLQPRRSSVLSACLPSGFASLLALSVGAVVAFGCDAGDSSNDLGAGGAAATLGGSPATSGGSPVTSGGAPATSGGSTAAQAGSGFIITSTEGMGRSTDRYAKTAVRRNGVDYYFLANGWGPNFTSHTVSWTGTSFTVEAMQGSRGNNYEPASYPTMFCGAYSTDRSGACGLPKAIGAISSLRTGWRWKANGNTGQYNAAYDIWLSNTDAIGGHSAFLMVWLRDPPGQQPAGAIKANNLTVANVPGAWNLWAGTVSGKPCISYVRAEGQDSPELEFNVMDFVRDVPTRGVAMPGTTVLSVAVGFEIWQGPVTNLVSEDFYVSVQ